MSDFNIKSFFKNRFIANNSLINNVKTGNPWTPWTNQKSDKTEETDETVELEDNNLTLFDTFNGNSFFENQIPEKGLKPLPAEENNDTAKSDNKQKVTPGWLEKLLNGPKVSDRNLNNDIQLR